jgi:hypothetical protein
VKDFLGQDIQVGSWVACQGNPDQQEHGLVLHKVLYVGGGIVEMIQVRAHHWYGGQIVVASSQSICKNPNACVVVHPPEQITRRIEQALSGNRMSEQDIARCATWLYGKESVSWGSHDDLF